MPGRKFTSATNYRYGFNGKEEDDEVKGDGNQQDYGMRIYDTRLGRFLSVDPITKEYPELTPYQFASNSPIAFIDLDGMEMSPPPKINNDATYRPHINVQNINVNPPQEKIKQNQSAGINLGVLKIKKESYKGTSWGFSLNPFKTTKQQTFAYNSGISGWNQALGFIEYGSKTFTKEGRAEQTRGLVKGVVNSVIWYVFTSNEEKWEDAKSYASDVNNWEDAAGSILVAKGTNSAFGNIFPSFFSQNRITALGASQGEWGALKNAGKLADYNVLTAKIDPAIFRTAAGREWFWENINKPFLDDVISKKGIFKFFDDPNSQMIFHEGNPQNGLNFFGREVDYLKSKGYQIKDGYAVPGSN